MPDTKRATQALRDQGLLTLVYVATDTPDTAAQMRQKTREVGFTYPNLFNGSSNYQENFLDWNPGGNHHNFLINPQGVIVAKDLYMPELAEVLSYFVYRTAGDPALGVQVSAGADGSGGATVSAHLTSPDRQPLTVELDYSYVTGPAGGEQLQVNPGGDTPEVRQQVTFGDWSDQVIALPIPAYAGATDLRYTLRVLIPGTEALCGGQGVWVTERGRVAVAE